MGVTASPSWDRIKNKPTTVDGFGITDMGSQSVANATNATNASNAAAAPWTGITGKPSTVAGLGLSNFDAAAVAAQATGAAGAVGTYATMSTNNLTTDYGIGATLAGSSLRYSGGVRSGGNIASNSATVPTGTWRCMGNMTESVSGFTYNVMAVWLRIA